MFGLEHLVLLLEMSWSLIRMMQFWTWQEKSRTYGSVATNMAGNNMVQHNDCAAPQVEVRTHIFPLHSGKCELVVVLQLLPPHTQLPVCLSVWWIRGCLTFQFHIWDLFIQTPTPPPTSTLCCCRLLQTQTGLYCSGRPHTDVGAHTHTRVCVCVSGFT